MTAIQLDHNQYRSYDEDGEVLATRAVRVKTLGQLSEFGPGIAAVLRTGEEIETGDGIGVELSITDDQLAELGYFTADELFDAQQAPPAPSISARPKFAYCGECEAMVDPYASPFTGVVYDRVMHDLNLEVYCSIMLLWVPAYKDSKSTHSVNGICVDTTAAK